VVSVINDDIVKLRLSRYPVRHSIVIKYLFTTHTCTEPLHIWLPCTSSLYCWL